ncbi:MAG: hypothetical protein E7658_02075 [Ruminococcaceae bacterium]|nr:hypothetical protein [Oscillospiraceae bacterium]
MKIGLLPLYVKLYDDVASDIRPRLNAFYEKIAVCFEKRGIEVVRSPFCRLRPEFHDAVSLFEREEADAIVTLHMAYSPSLESIEALCDTTLPLIVLDTTETLEFTNEQDPEELMYCHGIHGVMDMCSMLTQRGVAYTIAAGHWEDSDVIERVCGYVRAAAAAKALRRSRVGLVGESFAGMGDFRVAYSELAERFGIRVFKPSTADLRGYYDGLTEEEVEAEKVANRALYDFSDNIIEKEYTESVRSCLALRKYVENNALTAFSVNFMRIGPNDAGITSMPFLECCKSMQKGIGYAGEGDVMTAAFTGALLAGYKDTTFVEIFCPDWKNDLIFLSHMGEVNYGIADTKPMICRAGRKYAAEDEYPYAGYARMKGGKGVYVNISRARDDYRLFVAPAEMQSYDSDTFTGAIRGWMKPENYTTAEFLEEHSRWGATHHSIFVYGATAEEMEYFGKLLQLETVIL